MDFLEMDQERVRVDESAHPFTTGMLDDVRITTHYQEGQPMASFTSVMHEAGHGLYDLNLPRDSAFTLRGQAISMGIHESQSRFIENIVGKNPAFLEYIFPKLQKILPPEKNINLKVKYLPTVPATETLDFWRVPIIVWAEKVKVKPEKFEPRKKPIIW